MSNLTFLEKNKFEKLFGMNSGYVLDFSDRTFQAFFADSAKIDIYHEKYNFRSGSKANRLRAFWDLESDIIVGKSLKELLDYWVSISQEISNQDNRLFEECKNIVRRLLRYKNEFPASNANEISEDDFINKEFKEISIDKLGLEGVITNILKQRIEEIRKCLTNKSALAVIFLCGSTLEGILLGVASRHPKKFNESKCSPKDKGTGQVKQFGEWTLNDFIEVAYDLELLKLDVKKFSHSLRGFRNYIHPYHQSASKFNPSEHTAKICWQVLQAAIYELSNA